MQPIALGPSLWLGEARSKLVKSLGKPSSSEPEVLSYLYVGKVPGKQEGKKVSFDRTNYLHLVLKGGRVQGLVASQSTTN